MLIIIITILTIITTITSKPKALVTLGTQAQKCIKTKRLIIYKSLWGKCKCENICFEALRKVVKLSHNFNVVESPFQMLSAATKKP